MFPSLFNWKAPAWLVPLVGPGSWVAAHWFWFACIIGGCLLFLLWGGERSSSSASPQVPPRIVLFIFFLVGVPFAAFAWVRWGPLQPPTYGFLVASGFAIATLLVLIEARRVDVAPESILDLSFWMLLSAMVGARLLYIITTWPMYWADWNRISHWSQWKLFRIWEGGLVFYGGFLGAALAMFFFLRAHHLSFWKLADTIVPSLVIGQFFGRIGCFAAGCCHGKVSSLPWSVTFPPEVIRSQLPLHPTQLYEALGHIILFITLLFLRSRKRFHGQVFAFYLLLYPLCRFVVEIFRGDALRGHLGRYDLFPQIPGPEFLSTSQFVSILLFLIGLGLLVWNRQTNYHSA